MKLRLGIGFVMAFFALRAEARISAVLSCADLYQRSDAIVKGEVLSVTEQSAKTSSEPASFYVDADARRAGAQEFVARLAVDRVILGTIHQSTIDVNFYQIVKRGFNANGVFIELRLHEYVLLFLRRRGAGYALLDLDHGKMPISRRKIPAGTRGKEAFHEELAALVQESDPELVKMGLRCMGEMGDGDKIAPHLKRLKDSKDLGVHYTSIAWMARAGDVAAIKEVVSLLQSEDFSRRSETRTPEHNQRIHDCIDALNSLGELKNPEIAPLVAPLLKHPDWGIRVSAVQAIGGLQNRQVLPDIMPLLNDEHKLLQHVAIMAMCEIAHPPNTMCPASDLFEKNSKAYVADWKAWWQKNQPKKP